MKKIKIFAVTALLLTAFAMCAACSFNSSQSSRQKLTVAFKALDQAYAIDISMSVTALLREEKSKDNTKSEVNMRFKAIDTSQEQTAYIYMDEDGYENTLYFSQGYICEYRSYGYSIYEARLDDFVDDYGLSSAIIDINELSENFAIKKKSEGRLDKYTLTADNTAIGELLNDILGAGRGEDFKGSFTLNAWLDKSGNLKRLAYLFKFKIDREEIELVITLDINAVNAGVSINIPDEIAAEIAKYTNMPTLTLIADPYGAGSVYGAGKYKEGYYVSLTAYPNYGYTFVGWYKDDILINNYYYYTYYMPSTDTTLTARFEVEVPTYYIYTNYDSYGYAYVQGNGYAKAGESVTVTAQPYQGYIFLGWYENDAKLSEDLEYTFLMPARDMWLTAKFGVYVEEYTNTSDGVVKYYNLSGYQNVIYDTATEQFIVLYGYTVEIFTASMFHVKTLYLPMTPVVIDADNGVLAVGFGDNMRIHLYSLNYYAGYAKINEIQTNTAVYELVIDGDILIYTNNNQWCDLIFYSISGGNIIKGYTSVVYYPRLTLNRADHILYVAETSHVPSALIYFNTQTGESLFRSEYYQFGYNIERVLFDGKYVHYYGGTFDRFTGGMVSDTDLNRQYNKLTGFNAIKTLYDSDDLAFVFGNEGNNPFVGVYDNAKEKFIYTFNFAAVSLEHIGGSKYFAKNLAENYIAIIDLSLVYPQ